MSKKNNNTIEYDVNLEYSDSLVNLASAIMKTKERSDGIDYSESLNAAILKILEYFGIKKAKLENESIDEEERINLEFEAHGIAYRTVELSEGWSKKAIGVMLGKRSDDGSAVALIPNKTIGYKYHDPKSDDTKKLSRDKESLFEKEAIVFYRPLPNKVLSLRDLLVFVYKSFSVRDLMFYVAALFVVILLGLVPPLIFNQLFNYLIPNKMTDDIISILILLSSVMLSGALIGIFRDLTMARINTKISLAVETSTMMRLLSLPVSFFRKYSSGDLNERANSINKLCSSLITTTMSASLTLILSIIYIINIHKLGPELMLPALLAVGVMLVISVLTTIVQSKVNLKYSEQHAKNSGDVYNMLSGIQKIKGAGIEQYIFSKWANSFAKEERIKYKPPVIIVLSKALMTAAVLIGTIVMYFIAESNSMSPASFYSFSFAYGMLYGAFMSYGSVVSMIAEVKPAMDMAKPILEELPENYIDKKNIGEITGKIEMFNVSFSYDKDSPKVINDVSLTIEPGQFVAITGPSGCGKTTLMRLMQGMDTPKEGVVYYDETNIAKINIKSLRRQMGTVMQNDRLFDGDILTNIKICAPWISDEEAWEAAELAGMADAIKSRPMGMYTPISSSFGALSGGQKQRLFIARAIAGKPKVLMFDEATSALDNSTQKKVTESLDSLKCTRVVIAHRLSTIMNSDVIFYMENGRIVEKGTYKELIELNGAFAEMVSRQQMGE